MEFWLVVVLIIGLVLVCAAISDRRARRYHRLRSHREMAWMHRPGSAPQRSRSDQEEWQ